MISPRFSIAAEVYMRVARGTVWQKFCQRQGWPRWDTQVVVVRGLDNQTPTAWQEGDRFQMQLQNPLGLRLETAIVRMVVPDDTLVWESAAPGVNVVYSAHFTDELGGCKLRVRHTYHGPAVFLLWLTRGRQQTQLNETLHTFREYVERR